MRKLLIFLWYSMLCVHITKVLSLLRQESFVGTVEEDAIIYMAVSVPRYAQRLHLSVWAEETSTSPVVYLKYNALPTLTRFDASYLLPKSPLQLEIIDNQPTESVLFIGVFGGALLHSFKYFAGSASSLMIGVDVEVESCESELQLGRWCETLLESIALSHVGSNTRFSVQTGQPKYPQQQQHQQHHQQSARYIKKDKEETSSSPPPSGFALMLPRGVEALFLEARLVEDEEVDVFTKLCKGYAKGSSGDSSSVRGGSSGESDSLSTTRTTVI